MALAEQLELTPFRGHSPFTEETSPHGIERQQPDAAVVDGPAEGTQQRGNRIRKRKAISIFRIQHARTAGEARSMAARSREQIPSADWVVG